MDGDFFFACLFFKDLIKLCDSYLRGGPELSVSPSVSFSRAHTKTHGDTGGAP